MAGRFARSEHGSNMIWDGRPLEIKEKGHDQVRNGRGIEDYILYECHRDITATTRRVASQPEQMRHPVRSRSGRACTGKSR